MFYKKKVTSLKDFFYLKKKIWFEYFYYKENIFFEFENLEIK